MARIDIKTVTQLKFCVSMAKSIYVQPRFGTSEAWVKITKAEAKAFVEPYVHGQTPEDCEMYTDIFGTYQVGSKTLYLG